MKSSYAPARILGCPPEFFDVLDEKNPHMQGKVGNVDLALAKSQWNTLFDVYETLKQKGYLESIHLLTPTPGAEDMVFCANPSFPFPLENGTWKVVLSRMKHASRRNEVPAFEAFFKKNNIDCLYAPNELLFEGMGDAIPIPHERHILLGTGYRTSRGIGQWLSNTLNTKVTELELIHPEFYHLDTCLIPISKHEALLFPNAFSEKSLKELKHIFSELHEVSYPSAKNFGLNAHFFPGTETLAPLFVAQKGIDEMANWAQKLNAEYLEVDTSEFMKSGGSVFCMKVMF
jgi:N-dimethylarginine dimethylaminohydrolase